MIPGSAPGGRPGAGAARPHHPVRLHRECEPVRTRAHPPPCDGKTTAEVDDYRDELTGVLASSLQAGMRELLGQLDGSCAARVAMLAA